MWLWCNLMMYVCVSFTFWAPTSILCESRQLLLDEEMALKNLHHLNMPFIGTWLYFATQQTVVMEIQFVVSIINLGLTCRSMCITILFHDESCFLLGYVSTSCYGEGECIILVLYLICMIFWASIVFNLCKIIQFKFHIGFFFSWFHWFTPRLERENVQAVLPDWPTSSPPDYY